MANYNELKTAIDAVIKQNGNNEITGDILQSVLKTIVSSVGKYSTFVGQVNKTTVPGNEDGNVFYLPVESGIYPNFDGIEIDLTKGISFINRFNGAYNKILIPLDFTSKAQLAEIDSRKADKTQIASYSSFTPNYSNTISGNGVGALTAFNNTPIKNDGVIGAIDGNFTGVGVCNFFIARKTTGNSFLIVDKFSVNISKAGANSLDVTNLSIAVKSGDYLGVNIDSTAQPKYGTDATVGFGWYQNQSNVQKGNTYIFSLVATANLAMRFNTSILVYAPKNSVYDKTDIDNKLGLKANNTDLFSIDVSNEIITGASASVAITLFNNVPSPKSGFISKIKLDAATAGTARFQVLIRNTYNSTGQPLDKDFFTGTDRIVNIENVKIGLFEYDLPNPIYINEGEYLAFIGGIGGVNPKYTQQTAVPNLGWWQTGAGEVGANIQMTYQPFSILFNYTIRVDLFKRNTPETNVVVNKITLTRNANDYNSLRDVIKNITDATEWNQYEIYVPNGVYFEVDLQGKKFVKVFGEDINKTILLTDATNTDPKYILPNDYVFPSERGKQIAAAQQHLVHTVFAVNDSHYENLTLKAIKSKYPCHLDNNSYQRAYFNRVKFVDIDCNFTIGIGVWSGQSLEFYNCISEREAANVQKMSVFIHNWNNQAKPCKVHFENTEFINGGYALLDELGSGHIDEINFINCINNSNKTFNLMVDRMSTGTTYWTNPETGQKEPNPQNVPYCLFLNSAGTDVEGITSSLADGFGSEYAGKEQREVVKFLNTAITNYNGIAFCPTAEIIQKGDILARTTNGSGSVATTMVVKKFQSMDFDIEIVGVALENNQTDENAPVPNTKFKYAPVGKIAPTKVSGAVSIANRTNRLIWDNTNGVLTGSATANLKDLLGLAFSAKATTGIDLLLTKLKKI